MQNTELNIIELVEELNDTSKGKKHIKEKYGFGDTKLRNILKQNGYSYNQKSKKWSLEEFEKTDNTRITFRLPKELYQCLKIQSAFEVVNSTDIIIKALEQYIPQSTKDIVKQHNNK